MHICISTDGYPYPGLPYSAFIGVLSEEMVRQGLEVSVIAPQSLTKHFIRGYKLVPRYYYVPVMVNGYSKKINVYRPYTLTFGNSFLTKLSLLCTRYVVEKTLRRFKEKPNICYSHFWLSAYNILNYAKKYSIPLFVATGEDRISIATIVSDKIIRRMHDTVKGVICVSTKNRDESISLGLTHMTKCRIFPNAINQNEFYYIDRFTARKKMGFPENAFIIAYCGRFNERKGVMRLSDAIKRMDDETVYSIFIGSNIEKEKYTPDCERILFMGELPHNKIVHYLNCADVFVLPSLAEGCSNSIVEAMACGLPIISSNLPFNFDILNDKNSILVNPMDIEALTKSIRLLKEDEKLKLRMSEASLSKANNLKISSRVTNIIDYIKEFKS